MHHLVSHEGNGQGDDGDDDDADVPAQRAPAHGGQSLSCDDGGDDAPAGRGRHVHDRSDGHKVQAKAIPGLNELSHAGLGPKDTECRGRHTAQEVEEENHEARRFETQAHEERADEAGGDGQQAQTERPPERKDVDGSRVGTLLDGHRLYSSKFNTVRGDLLPPSPLDALLRRRCLSLRDLKRPFLLKVDNAVVVRMLGLHEDGLRASR